MAARNSVKAGDIVEGRYRIINVLSEGGMGTVFLAEHVLIQRRVALKILHPDLATDADIVEHFMNEARAAGTLGHPNIVESTDMGFTREDIPYIVFEYLEGSPLTDEIYRVGGLPLRRALRITHQIASALDAAHNAGIVHRDLKSDNIFLTDREDVSDHTKVLDFGISRLQGIDLDRSRPGQVMGTPEYMAPEQITSPEKIDRRTDIYALGVILYEMLTARRPFHAQEDPHSVLHQVVHDPPPPLDVPNLPPGLQEMILSKLLVKDPDKRYQSMKDVQGAIEAFHLITRPTDSITPLSIPIPAIPVAAMLPPEIIPLTPPVRRSRRSIALLASALLFAGAGVGLLLAEQRAVAPATTNAPHIAALEAEAEKLAALLDSEIRAAQLRADGVASAPMLRAAVETDAATLTDMARESSLFSPKPGEVLEVFQARDNTMSTMLRLPSTAGPGKPLVLTGGKLEAATRIESHAGELSVIVGAPIERQQSKPGESSIAGGLVLAVPIDLTATRRRILEQVPEATLLGLDEPVILAGSTRSAGVAAPVSIPLAAMPQWKSTRALTISAVFPATATPPAAGQRFSILRYVLWALAGALLVMYVLALLRGRARG